jgi:SAM-dependent methyltransferase
MEHRWIAKALMQKAVSKTGMLRAYHFAQRVAGGLRHFDPSDRIVYAGMIAADVGLDKVVDATAVEVGTGWVPIIPLGLHLLGVRRILSFDLTVHLMPDLMLQSLTQMGACLPDLARQSGIPLSLLQERFAQLVPQDFDALARQIGFEYHAPLDVARSAIPTHSVDLVYSNAVFEHVTPQALTSILEHSRRILKPGGLAWHNIDYSDHYAYTFKDLSLINFLRYKEGFWSMFGQSDLHYQNRLRRSDYVRAFEAAGFEVVHAIDDLGLSEADARKAPLAKSYDLLDLTCTSSRFVLKPRA